jgi:hypothetical protein
MGAQTTASIWPTRTLSRVRKRSSSNADGVSMSFPAASVWAITPFERLARTASTSVGEKPCCVDQRGACSGARSSSSSSRYPWRAPTISVRSASASRRKASMSSLRPRSRRRR